MIEIIPAMDIINGKCVRLTRGDYVTMQEYGDAVTIAQQYEALGFSRLHLVDLDGAKEGHIVNLSTIKTICKTTHLTVDCGGGIRTTQDLYSVFDAGAKMVSVGSVAVTHSELFTEWLDTFGVEQFILCADTRDGKVSINGWQYNSPTLLTDFLAGYLSCGIRHVLITDISHDGTLMGPSLTFYKKVMETNPHCHLIASGGVSSMADIDLLEQIHVPAVVVGKAIYEGKIDLKELQKRCSQRG